MDYERQENMKPLCGKQHISYAVYYTMEAMVKRSAYNANNRSIAGTKLVANAGPHDEIYTRFGDVTIDPNQLQIKTGSAQIDVPKNKFAAKANEWYMLTFVYGGKMFVFPEE